MGNQDSARDGYVASQTLLFGNDVTLRLRLDLCRFFLRSFPFCPAYPLGGSDPSARSKGHSAARLPRQVARGVIQTAYHSDGVFQLIHFFQHFLTFCLQLT
jgi:hypothetical protein